VANIAALKVPYIYIRGNHDSTATAAAVARQPNARVIDNQVVTVDGLTFAGIGDPRFTPDKSVDPRKPPEEAVVASGQQLAGTVVHYGVEHPGRPVDVAMVHDPASATPLVGHCPLIVAGHVHQRQLRTLDPVKRPAVEVPNSLLMVEGSTGGAGLRGLESTEPLPLALSVLYFDRTHTIAAYDDIRVGGTGQTQVSLERHLVNPKVPVEPSASPTR